MTAGITGHQDLGDHDTQKWVARQINSWVTKHDIKLGYSSLAAGADQLFAQVLLRKGVPVEAIIPCKNYETTFHDRAGLERFNRLLGQASSVLRLQYPAPSEEAFWAAGTLTVEKADLMVAVWDGKLARGLGGTADAVAYAQTLRKPIWQINPVNRSAHLLGSKR